MERVSMRSLTFLTYLCVCFSSFANSPLEPSLCNSSEKVLFSCKAKNRVISICTSELLDKTQGKLTYKYGKIGQTTELSYSATYLNFEEKFNYAYSSYAKGAISELSFNIGDYQYTLHADTHVFRESSSGVFVEKNNKIIAYKECDNSHINNNLYTIKKAGFKTGSTRGIGTKPD